MLEPYKMLIFIRCWSRWWTNGAKKNMFFLRIGTMFCGSDFFLFFCCENPLDLGYPLGYPLGLFGLSTKFRNKPSGRSNFFKNLGYPLGLFRVAIWRASQNHVCFWTTHLEKTLNITGHESNDHWFAHQLFTWLQCHSICDMVLVRNWHAKHTPLLGPSQSQLSLPHEEQNRPGSRGLLAVRRSGSFSMVFSVFFCQMGWMGWE